MSDDGLLTSQELVRLLAAPDRRKIVAALELAGGSASPSELAEATDLDLRSIVDAADRLSPGGFVQLVDGAYVLDASLFQQAARAEVAPPAPSAFPDELAEVARVLDTVFVDGRMQQWPAKKSKRLVVLDYLCQQFEIGTRYSEAQVNDILRPFNDDVAMSRRYLVDEQFLDRSNGQYWRCGGTV